MTADDVIRAGFGPLMASPEEVRGMIEAWPVLAESAKAARRPDRSVRRVLASHEQAKSKRVFMKITSTETVGCYLVERAAIPGRSRKEHPDWHHDNWHYAENGSIFGPDPDGWLTAVVPSSDGEGTEEIELDLSQGYAGMEDTLFARVAFMRRFVAAVIKSRDEAGTEGAA